MLIAKIIFFCKADIENFFYSVSRNRVVKSLKEAGINRCQHYGKWSCVKNPFSDPRYSLPYGFVQSPIIASLALSKSALGEFLRGVCKEVTVSVYVDDISISSNDLGRLQEHYHALLLAMDRAAFPPRPEKCIAPSPKMEIFNCSLQHDKAEVLPSRREEFFRIPRSKYSIDGFERYCDRVESGNGHCLRENGAPE